MTRRAFHSPVNWKQNLLLAMAMGPAAVLLGCGGGGGGGGTTPPPGSGDCGSAAGAGTVVCGYVVAFGTTSGVNGATVRVKNSAGTTIASGPTQLSAGSDGYYKIPIPAGTNPALISVDVPSTGFLPNYLRYKNQNYDSTRSATPAGGGGPCIPAITVTANQDNRLFDNLFIYSDSSAPPPPVFICPR